MERAWVRGCYYISWTELVLFCAISDYYWKEGCHIPVEITINKQLMHTFLLNFVVSLQSRFYTLALIFVFDVNMHLQYSSTGSLKLFKIDPVVSRLPAITHQQYLILLLSFRYVNGLALLLF